MRLKKKIYVETRKHLRRMGIALISAAGTSSLLSYFFLPRQQREPIYMMALVFAVMAVFCLFRKRD